jgi:hypothetical protein
MPEEPPKRTVEADDPLRRVKAEEDLPNRRDPMLLPPAWPVAPPPARPEDPPKMAAEADDPLRRVKAEEHLPREEAAAPRPKAEAPANRWMVPGLPPSALAFNPFIPQLSHKGAELADGAVPAKNPFLFGPPSGERGKRDADE